MASSSSEPSIVAGKAVRGAAIGVGFVAIYYIVVILRRVLGPYVTGVAILAGFSLGGERLAYNGWFLFFFPFLFYAVVGSLAALSVHLVRKHGPFLLSWPMPVRAITKGAFLGLAIYLGLLFLSLGFGRGARYILFLPGRITALGIGRDDLANSITFILVVGFLLFAFVGGLFSFRRGVRSPDESRSGNMSQ